MGKKCRLALPVFVIFIPCSAASYSSTASASLPPPHLPTPTPGGGGGGGEVREKNETEREKETETETEMSVTSCTTHTHIHTHTNKNADFHPELMSIKQKQKQTATKNRPTLFTKLKCIKIIFSPLFQSVYFFRFSFNFTPGLSLPAKGGWHGTTQGPIWHRSGRWGKMGGPDRATVCRWESPERACRSPTWIYWANIHSPLRTS